MIKSTPHRLTPGALVAVRPRKGCAGTTYAKVVKHCTPYAVRVIVTADSGGRRRGDMHTAPLGCVSPRTRGRHRKAPRQIRRVSGWWGR